MLRLFYAPGYTKRRRPASSVLLAEKFVPVQGDRHGGPAPGFAGDLTANHFADTVQLQRRLTFAAESNDILNGVSHLRNSVGDEQHAS